MKRLRLSTFARRETALYIVVAFVTMCVTALALELWRMTPSVPFDYFGDALQNANYLDSIRETGWYEVQPDLGAPFGLIYHDFPAADHLHLAIMGLILAVVPKFGFAMNAYYLIGFPLAAVTATWLLRTIGVHRLIAGSLAIVFAIAPYHLRKTEQHLFLTSYWPMPLFFVLVVRVLLGRGLWNRAQGRTGPLSLLTGQNAVTLLILLLAGSATQYYALFDLLLLALAALIALARDRQWRRLAGQIVAGTIVALTLLANMMPDLLYSATSAPSHGAADRPPIHSYWFAINVAQIFLPALTHRFEPFRDLAQSWAVEFLPYANSNVGLVGSIGVIILLVTLTAAAGQLWQRRRSVPDPRRALTAMFGALLLWILLLATTGGLATFIALLITTKVRGWDRLSIYVTLLGIVAVGLTTARLLRFWRRKAGPRMSTIVRRFGAAALAAAIFIVGYWDQTSPLIVPTYAQNLKEYTEDGQYATTLEALLPKGSSIYQLPYQPFPEGTFVVNKMTDYDHVKLGLFTEDLRYSYGGAKGRPTSDWPQAMNTATDDHMIDAVTAAGFAGISIDRMGYADQARELEQKLSDKLGVTPIVSIDGTYSFWDLRQYAVELEAELGAEAFATLGYDTLHPVIAYGLSPEMLPKSSEEGQSWVVRSGTTAQIALGSAADAPRTVRVSFYIGQTYGLESVDLEMPDGTVERIPIIPGGMGVVRTVAVPPGEVILKLITTTSTRTDYEVVNLLVLPVE